MNPGSGSAGLCVAEITINGNLSSEQFTIQHSKGNALAAYLLLFYKQYKSTTSLLVSKCVIIYYDMSTIQSMVNSSKLMTCLIKV